MTDDRQARKMDTDRKSFQHRRGDPDIVHRDPPSTCPCNKPKKP